MPADTLPDMDVQAQIIGSPGVMGDAVITHRIPMRIIDGHYKGQLFDVTMTNEKLDQFLPFGPGDTFICSIRSGTATFKVRLAPDHNNHRG